MKDYYTRELFEGLDIEQAQAIQRKGTLESGEIRYFTSPSDGPPDLSIETRTTSRVNIVHIIGDMATSSDVEVVMVGNFDDKQEGYITTTSFVNVGTIDIFPNPLLAETEYHLRYGRPDFSQPS